MNKKVVIIISAVVAFFAGAIWVNEVPAVAPLVAFLEVGIGFVCGFFYAKFSIMDDVHVYKLEIEDVKDAHKKVLSEKQEEKATKATKTSTKKSKTAKE